MSNEKKTLENELGKIVKESKSLEDFQNKVKEFIKDTFIHVLDEKKIPVEDITLGRIQGVDLLVTTFWNKKFSEGRITCFSPEKNEENEKFENLAHLNLLVFGRGTTLNERLLSIAKRYSSNDYVQFKIDIIDTKDGDFLKCSSESGKATITLGKVTWEKLGNIAKQDSEYNNFRQRVLNSQKISDGARIIRHVFGPELRKERLKAIVDNWAKYFKDKKEERSFFRLLYETTPYEQIVKCRQDQGFIGEEGKKKNKRIKFSDLSLGLDFELVDEFASFLQALAHFYPEARSMLGFCKPPNDVFFGWSVHLLSKLDEVEKTVNDSKNQVINALGTFKDKIYVAINELKNKFEMEKEKREKRTKESDYQDKFHKALSDSDLSSMLKGKIEGLLKEFPGLQNLLNAVALLSSKVHEARRLSFTFLYGYGDVTSWKIIEDILSDEQNRDYQREIESPEDFAKIIEIHWSIFQGERVAGFIDATKQWASDKICIPFTKIVKLKPYHNLPVPLFKKCVEFSHDSLIIYTSGNGIVRAFSYEKVNKKGNKKGTELFRWDTVNNKIEEQSVKIDEITDDILKLTPWG